MESIERANVAFFSQHQPSDTPAQSQQDSELLSLDHRGATITDATSSETTMNATTEFTSTSSDLDGHRQRLENQVAIDSMPEVYRQLYRTLLYIRTTARREFNNGAPRVALWQYRIRPAGMPELGDATPADALEVRSMIAFLEWQAQRPDQPTSEDQLRTRIVQLFQLRRLVGGDVRWPWESEQIRESLGTVEHARQLRLLPRLTTETYGEIYEDLVAMQVAHEIYAHAHPGEPSPNFRLIWPMVPGLGDARPGSAAELEFLMRYVEWEARRPERDRPSDADHLRQRMVWLLERLYHPTASGATHLWETDTRGAERGHPFDRDQQVIARAAARHQAGDDNDSQTEWVLVSRAPAEWEDGVEGQVERWVRNGGTGNSEMERYRDTLSLQDLHLLSSRAGHGDRVVHDLLAATQARQDTRLATANGTTQRENAGADSEIQERRREGRPGSVPTGHGEAGATSNINESSAPATGQSLTPAPIQQQPSSVHGPAAPASSALHSELLDGRVKLPSRQGLRRSSSSSGEFGAVYNVVFADGARRFAQGAGLSGDAGSEDGGAVLKHQRREARQPSPPAQNGRAGASQRANGVSAMGALQHDPHSPDSEPEAIRSMSWTDGLPPARDVSRGWTSFGLHERHRARICHMRDCEFNSDHQCDLQALATRPETYHSDDASEEDLGNNSVMEVLVQFEGCGHSNVVRLERPMVCEVAGGGGTEWRTGCGCGGFGEGVCEFRKGTSLGRCVYCSYSGQLQRGHLAVYAVMTRVVARILG